MTSDQIKAVADSFEAVWIDEYEARNELVGLARIDDQPESAYSCTEKLKSEPSPS